MRQIGKIATKTLRHKVILFRKIKKKIILFSSLIPDPIISKNICTANQIKEQCEAFYFVPLCLCGKSICEANQIKEQCEAFNFVPLCLCGKKHLRSKSSTIRFTLFILLPNQFYRSHAFGMRENSH